MKLYFFVNILIAHLFFTCTSINGMNDPQKIKGLVRTQSGNYQPKSNPIADSILDSPWEDKVKRHLLELAEWHAHEIAHNKKDEEIYRTIAKRFGQSNPIGIDNRLPKLTDPTVQIPPIENPSLKSFISHINKDIRDITIKNFDAKIDRINESIHTLVEKTEKPDYQREHSLDKLITQQLNAIHNKMNFTHNPYLLKADLEKISPYKSSIKGINQKSLEKLEQHIKTIENITTKQQQEDTLTQNSKKNLQDLPIKKTSVADEEITVTQQALQHIIQKKQISDLPSSSKVLPITPFIPLSPDLESHKKSTPETVILPSPEPRSPSQAQASDESTDETYPEIPNVEPQAPSADQPQKKENPAIETTTSTVSLTPQQKLPEQNIQPTSPVIPQPQQGILSYLWSKCASFFSWLDNALFQMHF